VTVGAPGANVTPFFCLLEDDNLIVSVPVHTHQLLESVDDKSLVEATIQVTTSVTRPIMGNMAFA
jgi:hypothetical protein